MATTRHSGADPPGWTTASVVPKAALTGESPQSPAAMPAVRAAAAFELVTVAADTARGTCPLFVTVKPVRCTAPGKKFTSVAASDAVIDAAPAVMVVAAPASAEALRYA